MTPNVRLAVYRAVALRHPGRITSHNLAVLTGVHATQVRRDLSRTLGRIGTRGQGYDTEELVTAIDEQLADGAQDVLDAIWREYRLLGMVLADEAKAVAA